MIIIRFSCFLYNYNFLTALHKENQVLLNRHDESLAGEII